MELVGKIEFAATTPDLEDKIYIVHIVALASSSSDVYDFRQAQIVFLKMEGASTTIPNKYANFADIFLPDLAPKLSEHTRINNYTIDLINSKKPSYDAIYSLGPVELETLKTYIKTNLANVFIKPSKSPDLLCSKTWLKFTVVRQLPRSK